MPRQQDRSKFRGLQHKTAKICQNEENLQLKQALTNCWSESSYRRLEVSCCLNLAITHLYVKHEMKALAKFILPALVACFPKVPHLLEVELLS